MNKAKLTKSSAYRSPLRESQAQGTRERIADAVFSVFQKRGGQEDITFKDVAREAGVTEMTVYRHFPKREDLLQALWGKVNAKLGVPIPESVDALLGRNQEVYQAYERSAPMILASIMTPQGREMRLSRKANRQEAFLKVAAEVNPRFSPKEKKRVAAILQLLQSSYAWDSLRSNWDMNPKEIADSMRLAIDAVIQVTGKKEKS